MRELQTMSIAPRPITETNISNPSVYNELLSTYYLEKIQTIFLMKEMPEDLYAD